MPVTFVFIRVKDGAKLVVADHDTDVTPHLTFVEAFHEALDESVRPEEIEQFRYKSRPFTVSLHANEDRSGGSAISNPSRTVASRKVTRACFVSACCSQPHFVFAFLPHVSGV